MHLCATIVIIICTIYVWYMAVVSIRAGGAIEPTSRGLFAMVLELMNCGSLAEHLSEMGTYLLLHTLSYKHTQTDRRTVSIFTQGNHVRKKE